MEWVALMNALPAIMQGIQGMSGMMGGSNNPATGAQGILSQIPGQAGGYLKPYMDTAGKMNPMLTGIYEQMMQDPSGFMNTLGKGYTESPGYQYSKDEALRAAGNAEAAGGMAGSSQHQQRAQEVASGLASKDFNDYMQRTLGMLGMGLQGGENVMGRGFGASGTMANMIADMLGSQASYNYAGTAGQNQANQQNMQNIFQGAGNAMPWLFGKNQPTTQQWMNRPQMVGGGTVDVWRDGRWS